MDASRGSPVAGEELRKLEEAFGAAFAVEGSRSVLLGLRVDRLEHFSDQGELAQAALVQMLAQRADAATWLVQRIGATWWVLVPGADAKLGLSLARELAQSGRSLAIEEAGKVRRFSISCALAHSSHATRPTLATCAAVVEEGLRVAVAGGGRRAVHSEVYAAYASAQASAAAAAGGAVAPARAEPLRQVELPRAQATSASKPATATSVAAVANALRAEKKPELASPTGATAASTAANAAVETSVLHRRLTKLSHELEKAEAEIARLRSQVAREGEGLASIYREVQGLAEDAASAELKREMMTRLFEANLALRELAGLTERAKLPA